MNVLFTPSERAQGACAMDLIKRPIQEVSVRIHYSFLGYALSNCLNNRSCVSHCKLHKFLFFNELRLAQKSIPIPRKQRNKKNNFHIFFTSYANVSFIIFRDAVRRVFECTSVLKRSKL